MTRAALAKTSLAALLARSAEQDGAHKLVWTLFSETATNRGFLYRSIGEREFIIVSQAAPSDPHSLWRLETKTYTPDLPVNARFGFALRANPAISIPAPGAKRGKRADIVMHAKRPRAERLAPPSAETVEQAALGWLYKRAERMGVRFEDRLCSAAGYRTHRILRREAEPIQFASIEYEGVLSIEDPERARTALQTGIGKAKAFGCGLLLLRPL